MSKEIFLIENDKGQIALFAPLKGLIVEIKDEEKGKVLELISQADFSCDVLDEIFPEMDRNRLYSTLYKVEEGHPKTNKDFRPDSAVIFTTLNCNLRCIYCYSSAGEQKLNMSWQTAQATIDFIVDNAKLNGCEESTLDFHGGGEPTFNWTVFKGVMEYFLQKARRNNLVPKINLATNGMLSNAKIEWIASHINSVQISLDGTQSIQDFQRPTKKGKGSFAVVYNTVKTFLAKGTQVVVHCTVTENSVSRIPEIVYFLVTTFPNITIHLEPAYECGRALQTGEKFPSPELFVRGFIEAEKIAESFGVEVSHSGSTPRLLEFRQSFCSVSLPNFIVTPSGLVSACHEVAEEKHPLADHFIYGYLDTREKTFCFNYNKIVGLRSYAVKIDPICQECFAQYYCVGDCLVKSLQDNGVRLSPLQSQRCKINKELTKHHVFKRLFGKEV